jgi:N-acetylmuramoyl-L-alanine amidase
MRGVAVLIAFLAFAGTANAAPPLVTATAAPASGVAPLRLTLTASGDAASYTWALGDGAVASGAVVTHTYAAAGRYLATVTATGTTGETAQAAVEVVVAGRTLALAGPARADYGAAGTLAGSLRPALRGALIRVYRGSRYVTSVRTRGDGSFRARILLRSPGPYHARYGTLRSAARTVVLKPRLRISLPAVAPVGGPLALKPRLEPVGAGKLRIRVRRGGTLVATKAGRLPTGVPGTLRVEVASAPRRGWAPVRRVLTAAVVHPTLSRGSRGPSVLALERRLAELRYALPRVDSVYGHDTFEAVLAFQKVHGLPRTGTVEPWLWRRLARAGIPQARRGGDYIEVDKSRQVLFVVEDGEVARAVHVSTGATGNTPVGTWQVYRKVPGWDWVLWYPLYFLRGFAIHGYPSVPAYPASHGCVRVPMWIAPQIYDRHGLSTTVTVFA